MSSYSNFVLTDHGMGLLADLLGNAGELEFRHMAIGAGVYSPEEKDKNAVRNMTSLKDERQQANFLSIKRPEDTDGVVELKAHFTNQEISVEYQMTEIGIYAGKKGSTEAVLYCVAFREGTPDTMPDFSSGKIHDVKFRALIGIGDVASVTITYTQDTYVLVDDFLDMLGTKDISQIGDGTVKGAISTMRGDMVESVAVRDIQVVEALPEDAEGHPDTLYAVVDAGTIVETQDLPVQRRRAIFRGKNLGSAVTAAQWEGIAAGTFHDMFTGDYWEADGIRWVVADFDYFLGYGSGEGTTRHHVVILPDRILGRGKMNDTETNETGYHGCGMRSSGLDAAREQIAGVFGQERLLVYKSYMTNNATGGMLWADAVVEIPSAGMVLGTGTTRAIENGQLALFSLDRQSAVADREGYWLSGLQGKTSFDEMRPEGYVSSLPANVSAGIRPVFAIAGD